VPQGGSDLLHGTRIGASVTLDRFDTAVIKLDR